MSHYAVAVFTEQDGCWTYEDLLKPYDEDLDGCDDHWKNYYYKGRMLECPGEIVYPNEANLTNFLRGG